MKTPTLLCGNCGTFTPTPDHPQEVLCECGRKYYRVAGCPDWVFRHEDVDPLSAGWTASQEVA